MDRNTGEGETITLPFNQWYIQAAKMATWKKKVSIGQFLLGFYKVETKIKKFFDFS